RRLLRCARCCMTMERTRSSLRYPATYLLGTGAMLMTAPDLTLRLFLSTADYGGVMPRMAGLLIFTLGLIVVQIIRHRVEALYLTLIGVRVVLCSGWLGLYFYSRDVFFLFVLAVVGFGLVLVQPFLPPRSRAGRRNCPAVVLGRSRCTLGRALRGQRQA